MCPAAADRHGDPVFATGRGLRPNRQLDLAQRCHHAVIGAARSLYDVIEALQALSDDIAEPL